MLYQYGLRRADFVISQTATQERLLRQNFGLPSTVIPMPCPLSVLTPASLEDRPRPYRILWVGRIVENKRLEMFLHLAERAPELTFEVAGTPEDASNYGLEMLERARSLPNVVWHGRVARERMPALYRAALCLCCTATLEGFPNTFLEAWSEGTPVVSTFDPDQLIRSGELGAVGNTADDLLEAIRRLASCADIWNATSANARRHFAATHDPEIVMPQFERVFLKAAGL